MDSGPYISDALTNEPTVENFRELVTWLNHATEDMNAPYLIMAMARFIVEQLAPLADEFRIIDDHEDADEWLAAMLRAIMDHAHDDQEAFRMGRHINERY
jgi:hypothetical protein